MGWYVREMHLGFVIFIISIGPAILVPSPESQANDCGSVSVEDCFKKLQTFLRLTSLPYTSDKSELDRLCRETAGGYNCSVKLHSNHNCLLSKDKNLMTVFVDMAQYTYMMFCPSQDNVNQGYLRDAMLQHSDCILKHKKGLDCCAEQTKLQDLPIMNILETRKSFTERQMSTCCPLSAYIKCARTVVQKGCGELAGNLTFEYIRRSSGEQLEAVCQTIPNYPEPNPEACPDVTVPVCAGSRIEILVELMCLMGLLFVARNSYM